jgi:hypothetical protein
LQIFATCPVVKIVLIAGSPIRFSRPNQRVRRALGIFTPSTMAGSPSHSVRDIQEPPRSWVGVCAGPRTVLHSGRTRADAASSGWGNTWSINRQFRAAAAQSQRRRWGVGPEANRASVRLRRQVRSEMSFPPCETSVLGSWAASCDLAVPPRRAKSRRLTYCFDRLRMRTLGSLTTVPETPVVRNARQPFVSDDCFPRCDWPARHVRSVCAPLPSGHHASRATNSPAVENEPGENVRAGSGNRERLGSCCRTGMPARAADPR